MAFKHDHGGKGIDRINTFNMIIVTISCFSNMKNCNSNHVTGVAASLTPGCAFISKLTMNFDLDLDSLL